MQKTLMKININIQSIKRECVGINHLNDSKAFIEYSNDMYVYKNIDNYNPNKENKILKVFDDMIADMINNKKLNSIVTELFTRGRKLNISLIFITQSYFKVPKDVRNNSTHFFIMKIPNKRELMQIAINHSSDINTKDFIEIYRKCTDKPYSFLVINTTIPSNNLLRFRKNLNITMMTINTQIKDEKLQYNINRKAAKVSALSSGKLHKYEYLTGEDILPLTQQQIIEPTKFTYSPLGKAFDKQIKTIEDQGKKQVAALNTLKSGNSNKITIKKYTYDPNNTPFISKQKEIFNKLVDEKLEKITDLDKRFNCDDLIYRYKGKLADAKLNKFDNALGIINKIQDGKKNLSRVKNNQENFKLDLGEIKKGAKKPKEQKKHNMQY